MNYHTCQVHLNGSNFNVTQYRLAKDLDVYNLCHGAFEESSFCSCLLSIGLYRLRSTELRFETNNTCLIVSVLLFNQIIHRMTKKTPSAINQSFRLGMKHIWLK